MSNLIFSTFILAFMLSIFCKPSMAHKECVYIKPDATYEELEERLNSANKLIPEAEELNDQAMDIITKGNLLIVQNVTEERATKADHQSLLQEYNQALSLYRQHREEYFAHCKRYHQPPPGPRISSPYIPLGKLGKLKPMKLKVSDKCSELNQLEARLLNNEKRIASMLENLAKAENRESEEMLYNMWTAVYRVAQSNRDDAVKYNRLGIQKTAASSSKIHSEIAAATRDGILSYQKQVFGKFKRNNALQQAIYMRSNMHGRYAMMVLHKLNAMMPQGARMNHPGNPSFDGDQLQAESNALRREYAVVQGLYKKLRAEHKKQ